MSTQLHSKSVLIVGVGGLGCPAALALARAGVGEIVLCDNDIVDESNLHRQILFTGRDVGRDKLDAARDRLLKESDSKIRLERRRLLPDDAQQLVRDVDLVLEGADNFATKFLAADACKLQGIPIVHGAAVKWRGTALSISGTGKPCYRCLFEDLLEDSEAPNCTEAGVVGPVVGVVGSLMADLALDQLEQDQSREGRLYSFDGLKQELRSFALSARPDCRLCASASGMSDSTHASSIVDTPLSLYTSVAPS